MSVESENNKKLKAFFEKEYHVLKSFIRSRISESVHRDAEDIIQDVALKLFSGVDNYSPINNVGGFVYQSVKNKIIDIMRKNKSDQYDIDLNEQKLNEFIDIFYGKPDNIYPDEIKKELKNSIMNLKPNYRDIILAIDFEGYNYNEISEESGVPIGTLMSRRHRALSILHKKINTKLKNDD
ncbi:RNA polymerase sigma factor [Aureivirga sp. CE67]|uniref:RNA polymerase sigma factor n=1 Tax=Aureivirga sp. CE67 TaxID=1788983 RepID=UPI0018C9FF22|nr:sigma-70 family RNA polymerase sigma factor [Aureivirga sp. CE67]